jgi:predicted lysophospholipase L1 biosynthesis ABC-type transport system permease subunit
LPKTVEERNMKKPMQIVLGITLGAGIGTAMGVAAGHVAVWLAVGIAIGVVIGSNFRGIDCAQCAEVHEKHQARSQQPEGRS